MNIYESLGVKTYINAAATLTIMGGSIMPPEVLKAMDQASKHFVMIPDLQKAVGEKIAKLTNNEAAYISNGCAAGMVLTTAALIAGDDIEARKRLPNTRGMKNRVVTYGPGRVGYDFAIKQTGAKIVNYGDKNGATEEQLNAAITDRTACVFVFSFAHRMPGQLSLEDVVRIAHARNVPVVVDAAAQLPARENLWRFTRDIGVDAAIFSGGKGLQGPQSSGLIVGKKWLIDRIATMACPNAGIGRPMKVGKEEIIGLYTAIKLYMQKDMQAESESFEAQVQAVIDAFPGITTHDFPSEAGQPMPRAKVCVPDAPAIGERLKTRGVCVAASKDALYINPQTLQHGEIDIVIEALKQEIGGV